MNSVLLHILILWAVVATVLAGLYIAIRAGAKFEGLRYAGVFGFVGAAFGVVIGLTTFFASQHYADVRQAAQTEATGLSQVAALSGSFPRRQGGLLREQLFCYATDVIDDEWSRTDGNGAPSVEARQRAGYLILLRVGHQHPEPEAWYSDALRASLDTGEKRQDRLLLTQPHIPTQLWILIYLGSAIIVIFAFFFHLSSRPQFLGMLLAVVLMLTAVVAVLSGLDSPTQEPFGLNPTAMEAQRTLIGEDVDTGGKSPSAFCAALPAPTAEPAAVTQ